MAHETPDAAAGAAVIPNSAAATARGTGCIVEIIVCRTGMRFCTFAYIRRDMPQQPGQRKLQAAKALQASFSNRLESGYREPAPPHTPATPVMHASRRAADGLDTCALAPAHWQYHWQYHRQCGQVSRSGQRIRQVGKRRTAGRQGMRAVSRICPDRCHARWLRRRTDGGLPACQRAAAAAAIRHAAGHRLRIPVPRPATDSLTQK
jgi:hypothetical protein